MVVRKLTLVLSIAPVRLRMRYTAARILQPIYRRDAEDLERTSQQAKAIAGDSANLLYEESEEVQAIYTR